jgi:hypothetical protein
MYTMYARLQSIHFSAQSINQKKLFSARATPSLFILHGLTIDHRQEGDRCYYDYHLKSFIKDNMLRYVFKYCNILCIC